MSEPTSTCPTCGATRPADAPAGFCPNCVFQTAMPGAAAPGSEGGFGDYELLEELGRGGMGVVWKARQASLNRLVAVKLIQQGLNSGQVLTRFEAERQALALMDHPHIARVFEAGRTPEGGPFFVMELVEGIPITRFCDEHRLTLRQRLELFVAVCAAIQHAHQKGIIHRDIKPGNVLVSMQDGKPVPKVIDFGIAKAMGPRLTEETLQTELGAILGTLEYMSPEQARLDALDIDTRSDIYALGVLLYELLTGSTPLDRKSIRSAAFDEVLRRIREEEPPRPSTRLVDARPLLADTAARRGLTADQLPRQVAGDVDWIVMKALEKDRNRRYETANGLAQDILRHLRDEPVLAGPPTARYRLGKFVRKHRRAVAAAAAFVVLLAGAAVASALLAYRADRERARAVLAERTSTSVLSFFQDTVLAAARPRGEDHGLGHDVTIREAVQAAEPRIAEKFSNAPLAEASIRDVLGTTYVHLDQHTNAIVQHQRSLDLWRQHDPDNPRLLSTMNNLATPLQRLGRVREAVQLLEEVLRLRQERFGPEDPLTLVSMNNLAVAYEDEGRKEDSLRMHQETLRIRKVRLPPNHPYTLSSRSSVGASLLSLGRWQEALPLLEEALLLHRAHLPTGHTYTISCLRHLAEARSKAGRAQEALPLHREALEFARIQYPPGHREILSTARDLAILLVDLKKSDEAFALFEEILERQRAQSGPDHPDTLRTLTQFARALSKSGRAAESLSQAKEALQRSLRALEPGHPTSVNAVYYASLAAWELRRAGEVLPLLDQFLTRLGPHSAATNSDLLNTVELLVLGHLNWGSNPGLLTPAILEALQRACEQRSRDAGLREKGTRKCLQTLVNACLTTRRWPQALPALDAQLAAFQESGESDSPAALDALSRKGLVLARLKRLPEAAAVLEGALPRLRATRPGGDRDLVETLNGLAIVLEDLGRHEQALPLFKELVAVRRQFSGPEHPDTLTALNLLGRAHYRVAQYDESIRIWEETVRLRRQVLGPTNSQTLTSTENLASGLKAAGRLAEAVPWLEEAYRQRWRPESSTNRTVMDSANNLLSAYRDLQRPADAEIVLRQLLDAQRPRLPANSLTLATTVSDLGQVLLQQGRAGDALPLLRESLDIRERILPNDWQCSASKVQTGEALAALTQFVEAESLLQSGFDELRGRSDQIPASLRDNLLSNASLQLTRLYEKWGDAAKLESWRRKVERLQANPKPAP